MEVITAESWGENEKRLELSKLRSWPVMRRCPWPLWRLWGARWGWCFELERLQTGFNWPLQESTPAAQVKTLCSGNAHSNRKTGGPKQAKKESLLPPPTLLVFSSVLYGQSLPRSPQVKGGPASASQSQVQRSEFGALITGKPNTLNERPQIKKKKKSNQQLNKFLST